MNHELLDVQTGLAKGRGTRDQIANIRWIMDKAREFQKNIYFCFIGYAKAIDCVDHNKLWKNSSGYGNTRPPDLPLEEAPQAAFPSWCFPAQTKRRTEGIRVPVPLAWGGSSTARVLLRLCPESACQTGPSLELSSRLEAGGCAVRASPGRLGSLAEPQRRGTSP